MHTVQTLMETTGGQVVNAQSRWHRLATAALLTGVAVIPSACSGAMPSDSSATATHASSGGEKPDSLATTPIAPMRTAAPHEPVPNGSRVDMYLPNWLPDPTYQQMAKSIRPGSIRRLHYFVAVPLANGGISVDVPAAGSQLQKFIMGLGSTTEVSLSVGGYGDESAKPDSPSSRISVLKGMATAIQNPLQFAQSLPAARAKLAAAIGKKPDQIGTDIDFEYPTVDQTAGFTTLLRTVRQQDPKLDLSVAIPSRDNLAGYDLPTIKDAADEIHLMTYSNGINYTPADVRADVQAVTLQLGGDASKLEIGYSTDLGADPQISSAADFEAIHSSLKAVDGKSLNTAGSFVWTVGNGPNEQQLDILNR